MEFEKEKKQEGMSAEQTGNREGYQSTGNAGGYQGYRVGRSPRPRINNQQRSYNQERGGYNRNNNEEGGFRPEGFGAGLYQSGNQQRQSYRPRNNNGGYQQRGGYGQQKGGYQQRGGYGQQQGGYQQRGGYGQQGGYQQRGGFRKPTPGYDPNAKYSLKKRIEYKEENYDPNEPVRLNKFLANAGVCSRREADEFIQAGVVTVNGEIVTELGTKVLRTDEVKFHEQPVTIAKKVYGVSK